MWCAAHLSTGWGAPWCMMKLSHRGDCDLGSRRSKIKPAEGEHGCPVSSFFTIIIKCNTTDWQGTLVTKWHNADCAKSLCSAVSDHDLQMHCLEVTISCLRRSNNNFRRFSRAICRSCGNFAAVRNCKQRRCVTGATRGATLASAIFAVQSAAVAADR